MPAGNGGFHAAGGEMPLFLSNYTNRVDKKGRISVPAPFRNGLGDGFSGIVLYESFKHPCLEGSDMSFMEDMANRIDSNFSQYSDAHDAMTSTILGSSRPLSFDSEGRVGIPDGHLAHAGITDSATFVGLGKTFQIWSPDTFVAYQEEQRRRALEQASGLGPAPIRNGDRQ